jgi:hypothetical protein
MLLKVVCRSMVAFMPADFLSFTLLSEAFENVDSLGLVSIVDLNVGGEVGVDRRFPIVLLLG